MNKSYSPIIVFTYLRLKKLRKIINTLKKNKISKNTEIFFFSDNYLDPSDKTKIRKVRNYLKRITGFKKKKIICRNKNYGNGKNIIDGVTSILKKRKQAIILEDDLIIGKNFLTFMNQCLDAYKNEKKVWHVGAWNYDLKIKSDYDIFFSKNMNCWGWGTWSDRWKYFEKNPTSLIRYFVNNKKKLPKFNLNNKINYFNQILRNNENKIDTWAVFWYAQIFKRNGLCISPINSLVINNGFDRFSVHIHPKHFMNVIYKTKISKKNFFNLPKKIQEYKSFYREFDEYYNQKINIKVKLKNYLDLGFNFFNKKNK